MKSARIIFLLILGIPLALQGCIVVYRLLTPTPAQRTVTGSGFYREAAAMSWKSRDSLAVKYILEGHIPSFLTRLSLVPFSFTDSTGRKHEVLLKVTPDYLGIGTDQDWARIPLTPMAATTIADSFDCMLPTIAMVDAIYTAAPVKLEPVPLYAFRDSTPTFWHHHLIIEGQRQLRTGLIAGIKKDVVRSSRPEHNLRNDRVIIYGWHRMDGKPIQPVYAGHVNWYVDYSHGVRLISQTMKVDGKWKHLRDIENDPLLKPLHTQP